MLFIYIHGFNSSPASYKAKCFARYLLQTHPQDEFEAPELSYSPSRAIATQSQLIEHQIDSHERENSHQRNSSNIALIGSSLGGFYATWLAEKYNLPAVLINPAVNPQKVLVNYLGKNKNYHTGEKYDFSREHISQFDAITVSDIIAPQKLLVLLQTGDETLDYRLAENKYAQTHLIIEQGGDHSFQNFEQHCDGIYQFLTTV